MRSEVERRHITCTKKLFQTYHFRSLVAIVHANKLTVQDPTMTTDITIPTACDMHIHLRQGSLMSMVTPTVFEGGVSICYVMVQLFFLSNDQLDLPDTQPEISP